MPDEFEFINDEQLQDLWFEYTQQPIQDASYPLIEREMIQRGLLAQA